MAFLQRVINQPVINKGGRAKLRRDTEADALEQVTRYLDHLGLNEGWLVMFDLRSTRPWPERLFQHIVEHEGRTVRIVGC